MDLLFDQVSNVALGSIKTFASHVDPEVSEEIVVTAYDNGINYFDVCDPFMSERAERELGRIFAKKGWPRRSYFVSTRVFWHRNDMCNLSRKEILESVKGVVNRTMFFLYCLILSEEKHHLCHPIYGVYAIADL